MKILKSYTGHKGSILTVSGIKGQADLGLVFSAGEEDVIRVWDLRGTLLRKIKVPAVSSISAIGFLNDGQGNTSVIAASPNGIIQILDLSSGELIVSIRHRGLKALVVSDDLRYFVSAGLEGSLIIRDHQTGNVISAGGMSDIYSLSMFTGNNPYVVSCGNENIINMWDVCTGIYIKK